MNEYLICLLLLLFYYNYSHFCFLFSLRQYGNLFYMPGFILHMEFLFLIFHQPLFHEFFSLFLHSLQIFPIFIGITFMRLKVHWVT